MEINYIKEAVKEGKIAGLELALKLAELSREKSKDIDYLISSLKDLIKTQ